MFLSMDWLFLGGLCLDFHSVEMIRQDWHKILDLVEPLKAMDLEGSVVVSLPESQRYLIASQPLVFKDQIYFT